MASRIPGKDIGLEIPHCVCRSSQHSRAMKTAALLSIIALGIMLPSHAQKNAAPAAAAAKPAPAQAGPKVVNVTPNEAEKAIAEGVTVIDLRTEEEFEHEHIAGAKNINALSNEFEKSVAALDATKPILIHCQSGRRSSRALKDVFSKSKFPTIYHMSSGVSGWKKEGKKVETTPTPIESGKLPERLK
jgi:rhodanese-related sulfurtransferase